MLLLQETQQESLKLSSRHMKKTFFFILLTVCAFFLWIANGFSQSKFERKYSWSDEFKGKGFPNETYWKCEIKIGNTELQEYVRTKNNSFCEKGILHIRCIKEKTKNRECSSALLSSKGKKSFLYGKIDVRAKAPIGKGIFPAIWMMPEDKNIKPYGEIDLMEYIDCWKEKKIQTNVHVVYEYGKKAYQHQKKYELDVNDWHIYTLEWTKNSLTFLVDGKVVQQLHKKDLEAWPFDRPYYIILNVAFGGWGGSCGVDYNILPKEMLVDYVRYYRLKE